LFFGGREISPRLKRRKKKKIFLCPKGNWVRTDSENGGRSFVLGERNWPITRRWWSASELPTIHTVNIGAVDWL
jgi:hypothetical protein